MRHVNPLLEFIAPTGVLNDDHGGLVSRECREFVRKGKCRLFGIFKKQISLAWSLRFSLCVHGTCALDVMERQGNDHVANETRCIGMVVV